MGSVGTPLETHLKDLLSSFACKHCGAQLVNSNIVPWSLDKLRVSPINEPHPNYLAQNAIPRTHKEFATNLEKNISLKDSSKPNDLQRISSSKLIDSAMKNIQKHSEISRTNLFNVPIKSIMIRKQLKPKEQIDSRSKLNKSMQDESSPIGTATSIIVNARILKSGTHQELLIKPSFRYLSSPTYEPENSLTS